MNIMCFIYCECNVQILHISDVSVFEILYIKTGSVLLISSIN